MLNLLRAAEKSLLILFAASWYSLTLFLASSASSGLQNCWIAAFSLISGKKRCCRPTLGMWIPFWPISCGDVWLAHQNLPQKLIPGLLNVIFTFAPFFWWCQHDADECVLVRRMTSAGWCGRVTWQGDVTLPWGYGGWFLVSGAPPLSRRRFWGRGLRHSRAGDAWREYDGKTAHLPDANRWQVGKGEDPPTIDLGRARSNGWRNGQGGGGIRDGARALFKLI